MVSNLQKTADRGGRREAVLPGQRDGAACEVSSSVSAALQARLFGGLARGRSGYLHKASLQMNVSAVTAACMMMKKEVFEEVGGFEEELSVAFNDVDLCLRIGKAGYKIVYNPHVELYHYESKSRGAEG